jgi:hypothetical protein
VKNEKLLSSTLLAAIAVLTIDLKRGLPAPRRYVAVFLLWFLLGLVAQASPSAARAASRFSVLVLLTISMAVAGKLTGFLDRVAELFPLQPSPLASAGASAPAPAQPSGGLTA